MNGLLTRQTYGNGDKVEFTYDILGRAKTTTYKDENGSVDRVLTYVYTGDGQLYSIHDSGTGFLYLYTYDSIGRLIGSSVKNSSGEVLMSTRQEYNANNQLVGQHWTVGSTTYSETYTYDKTDGALTEYSNALGEDFTFNYDELRRLSSIIGGPYERKYDYWNIGTDKTTPFASSYHYYDENGLPVYSFSYGYDKLGNISRYTDPSGTQVYTYDAQNQLTRVEDADGNILYQYSYDNAGNILTANGHSYVYSTGLWKDQLASFDGVAFEYDAIGNPTSYYNGTAYTFTWEQGRNLVSAVTGSSICTYTYDISGVRASKTVNGVKHEYLSANGLLLREKYGNVVLDFIYDESGVPYALIYKSGTSAPQTYYYITNMQGDVLYLLDSDKQVVASYSYDPYGKVLTATGEMAVINPLRYRGYYYDAETGFYYLQSRYYDPTLCRFVSADTYAYTGQGFVGSNMYAYCLNNPVNYSDSEGSSAIWWILMQLAKMGYIHWCVQQHIKKNYQNVEIELWLTNEDGELDGRADVMIEDKVWEIKHATVFSEIEEVRKIVARRQAESYLGKKAIRTERIVNMLGPENTFEGKFTINYDESTYLVEYWTPTCGVILYKVREIEYQVSSTYVLAAKDKDQDQDNSSGITEVVIIYDPSSVTNCSSGWVAALALAPCGCGGGGGNIGLTVDQYRVQLGDVYG